MRRLPRYHYVLEDNIGLVERLGSMGGDISVVMSARVSTYGDEDGMGTPEKNQKLIGFLMRNGHGTPFEHVVFQFRVKAPIFVAREWFRHRIGSFNEQSGRYMEYKPEFYFPSKKRIQDPDNRQSAIDSHVDIGPGSIFHDASADAYRAYQELLEKGFAREQARIVLPVNLYTSFWWTVNARSLMNFLELRNHPTAMSEIRAYAQAIEEEFMSVMPWTHAAWLDAGRKAP
jgi:thymidylate synthase (FAD)